MDTRTRQVRRGRRQAVTPTLTPLVVLLVLFSWDVGEACKCPPEPTAATPFLMWWGAARASMANA